MSPELSAFAAWLRRRGRATSTTSKYVRIVQDAQDGEDLLSSLTRRKLSPSYRNVRRAALRAWAKFQKDVDLQAELSDIRIPPGSARKTKTILTRDQWLEVRAAVDEAEIHEPHRAILGLMVGRGFRRGDALRLKREEVLASQKTGALVFDAKGERLVEFAVNKNFSPYLDSLASFKDWDQAWELISPKEASAGTSIYRDLISIGDSLGIENLHPHKLRSTYASYYYERCGFDPKKLQMHMGWSKIETAMRYVVIEDKKALEEIAEGLFDA